MFPRNDNPGLAFEILTSALPARAQITFSVFVVILAAQPWAGVALDKKSYPWQPVLKLPADSIAFSVFVVLLAAQS